jgi:arylsulfatase A-like enzyme
MADVFTTKAVGFIERQRGRPFFLYFALHDPHVPRVPHPRFVGKTSLGPRGDVIVEADWSVGQILEALDRLKLADNTIVIFTSDNGAVVDDGYKDDAVAKLGSHTPSGPFRGGKYSHFEGGTRVPFILRWPGRVKPGTSDALVCQVDFVASFAALLKQPLAGARAPDSIDTLAAFLGTSRTGRTELIEQAGGQALRSGHWKYIEASKRPKRNEQTNTELGNELVPQLYDLSSDPGERLNLAERHPEKLKELQGRLQAIRAVEQR